MNYDAIIYQNILLEGQKERIAEEVLVNLKNLYYDLRIVAEQYDNKNLNEIYVIIRDLIDKHFNQMDSDLQKQLELLGFVHQDFENELYSGIEESNNIPVTALALSSAAMIELIKKTNVVDRTYTQSITANKKKLYDNVKNTVRFGLLNGQDLSEINKNVKTKVNVTGRDMNNFIQTAVRSTLSDIEKEVLKKNKKLTTKEIYLAVLDPVTTDICIRNHGKIFEIGEGQQVPAHFGCRSLRLAYFGSKNNLTIDSNYNDFVRRTKKEGLKETNSGNLEKGSVPKYSLETYEKKIMKNLES